MTEVCDNVSVARFFSEKIITLKILHIYFNLEDNITDMYYFQILKLSAARMLEKI